VSGTNRDDDAWRAIVDNYGERAQVDDLPASGPDPAPAPFNPTRDEADAFDGDGPVDRFVPPVPPPGPGLTFPDHLPWLGVLGIPVVLLVSLLASIDLPDVVGYLLVAGFVGSFVYLVVTMDRQRRDPSDDGAQL
jgi:hypothetical protein